MGSAPVWHVGFGVSPKRTFNRFMNPPTGILKPIPRKGNVRMGTHRLARPSSRHPKKSASNFGSVALPMIIWKDGKVSEVPA
jgi:hypothetical protein